MNSTRQLIEAAVDQVLNEPEEFGKVLRLPPGMSELEGSASDNGNIHEGIIVSRFPDNSKPLTGKVMIYSEGQEDREGEYDEDYMDFYLGGYQGGIRAVISGRLFDGDLNVFISKEMRSKEEGIEEYENLTNVDVDNETLPTNLHDLTQFKKWEWAYNLADDPDP